MKKFMQIFIFINREHFVSDRMSLPHLVRDQIYIGPTGQNLDATCVSRADIIWHGGTEYGSHILSAGPNMAAIFGPGPNLSAIT